MRKTAPSKSTIPGILRASSVAHRVQLPRELHNRPALVRLLVVLAGHADHDTGRGARPCLDTLAEAIQASRRTVQRLLETLERLGVVQCTLAHSWRLHRPATWAIAADVLREARRQVCEEIKARSGRYWESVRAWAREFYRRCPASGGQFGSLPSPLQGERRTEQREVEAGSVPKAPPGTLLDILKAIQTGGSGVLQH